MGVTPLPTKLIQAHQSRFPKPLHPHKGRQKSLHPLPDSLYNTPMPYEWDEAKSRSNLDKHEIDFQAIYEFDWDNAVTEPSPRDNELRYIAVGYIRDRLYTVIYTQRGNRRRIISLRNPSRRERRHYERQVR